MKPLVYLAIVLVSALVVAGCGTLPSDYDVEKRFRAEHPNYVVKRTTYEIKGERKPIEATKFTWVQNEAVFMVDYQIPGEVTNRTAYRRFRGGPEGWVEQ